MIVAMFLRSTYNIVNAIWVAGLGSDALAAVGFSLLSPHTPFEHLNVPKAQDTPAGCTGPG